MDINRVLSRLLVPFIQNAHALTNDREIRRDDSLRYTHCVCNLYSSILFLFFFWSRSRLLFHLPLLIFVSFILLNSFIYALARARFVVIAVVCICFRFGIFFFAFYFLLFFLCAHIIAAPTSDSEDVSCKRTRAGDIKCMFARIGALWSPACPFSQKRATARQQPLHRKLDWINMSRDHVQCA